MSQNIGSLVRRETNTLDMQQDSCMLYPRNWLRIYQLIGELLHFLHIAMVEPQ